MKGSKVNLPPVNGRNLPQPSTLFQRSRIIQFIRSFFIDQGFYEVETPLRIAAPAPEANIDAFSSEDSFLACSPELEMKMLLALGSSDIFQITRSFRKEERGRCHAEEFTILEWYRKNADYRTLMADCERLFEALIKKLDLTDHLRYQGRSIPLNFPFSRVIVDEIFSELVGWKPSLVDDEYRFSRDLVETIEPRLIAPTFLLDYPPWQACLARIGSNGLAERFEWYIGGMELANGVSELTDREEQHRRFLKESWLRRQNGKIIYPLPSNYLDCLDCLEQCAGIALGIDRLIMLLLDKTDIADVRMIDGFRLS